MKKILVAQAWPYANGSLHLGHIASLLSGDVIARHHRLKGDDVLFVSGTDCFGTPISVEALNKKKTPEEISEKYHKEFTSVFDDFNFSFDNYTKTNTKEHSNFVQEVLVKLNEKGYIENRVEKALFSKSLNRFLPDRFVEGTCPNCSFKEARGDQCDSCGKLLSPLELIDPKPSKKIFNDFDKNETLEIKESEQLFFKLSSFQEKLEKYFSNTKSGFRKNAEGITKNFLTEGVKDRAITRDIDWGVKIPDSISLQNKEQKRVYVWFEAVLGYLSASLSLKEESYKEWFENEKSVHYYVHGKDNVSFHTIILPAILIALENKHLPDKIFSSEYLLLEGEQFSSSRGRVIFAKEFQEEYGTDAIRYFLLSHGPETGDANFKQKEFEEITNGELIGSFGNFVNRVFKFVEKNFPDGVSGANDTETENVLRKHFDKKKEVEDLIEKGELRKALNLIMSSFNEANALITTKEPWKNINNDKLETEKDLYQFLCLIDYLSILIYPFLPTTSIKIRKMLNLTEAKSYDDFLKQKEYKVNNPIPLFNKIEN